LVAGSALIWLTACGGTGTNRREGGAKDGPDRSDGPACRAVTAPPGTDLRHCPSGGGAPTENCNTDINADPLNCGGCGAFDSRFVCPDDAPKLHAVPWCDKGTCAVACMTGYLDCDGDRTNGCEVDVRTSLAHCGRCGNACPGAEVHALSVCKGGTCSTRCQPGWASCGDTPGCNTSVLADPNNCGGCGRVCGANHAAASCRAGACVLVCEEPFADCDEDRTNGCETSLATDRRNCGACGKPCSVGGCFNRTCVLP